MEITIDLDNVSLHVLQKFHVLAALIRARNLPNGNNGNCVVLAFDFDTLSFKENVHTSAVLDGLEGEARALVFSALISYAYWVCRIPIRMYRAEVHHVQQLFYVNVALERMSDLDSPSTAAAA